MPTLRFSSDSNKSPTMPTAATARPRTIRSGQAHLRKPPVADNGEAEGGADKPANRPLDGFLRTDDRRQQMSSEHPPAVILKRVAGRDGQYEQQRRFPAEHPARRRQQPERHADVERSERRRSPPSAARRRFLQRVADFAAVPSASAERPSVVPAIAASTGKPGMPTATHASATAAAPAGRET